MKLTLSRALMTLAHRCLGEEGRSWAEAMAAEFETAAEDGHPLSFAAGCFHAALRSMPTCNEGRFLLTSYAVALILILPIAAVEISMVVTGLPHLFSEQAQWGGGMSRGQMLLIGNTFMVAWPSLALLLLVSGAAQLRLAWLILECDWQRAVSTGIAFLSATMTLALVLGCLLVDIRQAVILSAVLGIEMVAISGLGSWHADLAARPS